MLHRSFKPAKCKTALKLAVSRIKLLKNKREAHLKQLKRELAQLLEAGQDQTARIRVEHVVREEKTMAACDLIDIYCELIVARLPIIESQKNCPIDLKEAVSSVIFASPRCADIPELMDVRKHFTAKYGKEFVSAAVELRPECGVSRLLVEKLSAKAPDGPTKIKILSAIAEEHNVKWEPKSFGEKDIMPPEDLLSGPNTFEQASKMHMETSKDQKPANSVDKGPPNYQASSEHYEKRDVSVNSYGPSSRSAPNSQNFPSTDVGANEAMPVGTSHPDMRPFGTSDEGMEYRHPNAVDGNGFPLGRQNWNMEFTDATAAAQAAAESAELASMAARAAAELSSQGRISRQHSTESQKASAFGLRDERLQNPTGSKLQSEQVAKDTLNNTFSRRNSARHHEQSKGNEQDDLTGLAERFYNLKSSNKSSQLTSSKYSSASVNDHPSVNDLQMDDRHSRKSSSELEKSTLLGEESMKRESSESNVEFVSKVQDGMNVENVGCSEEVSIRKQFSSFPLRSHSRTLSDDQNVVLDFIPQKSGEEPDENPFGIHEGKIERNYKESNSYDNAAVAFDDSGSDDDESKFDVEHTLSGRESSLHLSSEGRKSSSHLLANTNSWSPRQNTDESLVKSSLQSLFAPEQQSATVFSEGLTNDTVHSQPDDLLPVTFDDSDGPSSESEGELGKSKLIGSTSTGIFPHKESVYSRNPEPTQNESPRSIRSSLAEKEYAASSKKTWLQPLSLDSDVVEVCPEENQGNEVNAKTDRKFGYGDLYASQPSPRVVKSRLNSHDFNKNLQTSGISSVKDNVQALDTVTDTTPFEESSLEIGKELNFGQLTGGLRNKGYRHPPYRRNLSNNSSFAKQAVEDSSSRIEQSSPSPEVDISFAVCEQEPYDQTVDSKLNKKTSTRTPVTYFDSGNDDSDEELLHQTFSSSQEPYNQKAGIEVNKKSSSRTYFDSDDSDAEEDLPKQTSASKTSSGTGFSRRTKAFPSKSDRNSYSKPTVLSESSVTADLVVERKSFSSGSYAANTQPKHQSQTRSSDYLGSFEQRISAEKATSKLRSSHESSSSSSSSVSYAAETRSKLQSQTKNSDYFGSSEQQRSAEKAASKLIPQSKGSSHVESFSRSSYATDTQRNPQSQPKSSDHWAHSVQPRSAEQETPKPIPESKRPLHKESLNSSAREKPFNPSPMTVASGSTENSKTSSSRGETPSRENSINKASHVHPKLPDYDTLTAHLLSLRQNRQ